VIGGGINGAVSAAALAGKGAKVTVVDKGDFASFTSQESSNLAWGGIKYLETYEFKLVHNLCKSRNELMRAYPSQIREIRFLTSVAKGFRIPQPVLYAGALLYWMMGGCRTKAPRLLSRARIKTEAPMVDTAPLADGLKYSDGYFVDNDACFCFGFIRKVLRQGSNAINYMELTAAEWKNGMWQCTLIDRITEESVVVKSRTLINATGPFADKVNTLLGIDSPFRHVFSRGAHIIVPAITKTRHVLTFFASDGRLFFMVPMDGCTCIGTTDTRVDSEIATPNADDVEFLLKNANGLLNLEKPLTPEDVIAQRCGVRPLVVGKDADVGHVEWSDLSRKHEIATQPQRKVCTIYGGKLTDCINIGEEVSEIIRSFGIPMYQTLKPWFGEPSARKKEKFIADAARAGLNDHQVEQVWRRYEADAFRCIDLLKGDPSMSECLVGDYTRAELQLIAEQEMVMHLEDFLRRRTSLALTRHRAALRCDPGLPEAAEILFGKQAESAIEKYFSARSGN
jgi:alpha-glycerophosphate oxidase/glycerol-3-phosphate dehydrogenase